MSAYLTPAQLLNTLGVASPTGQQTTDATSAVAAASGAVDNICQRGRNAFNEDAATSDRYYSPVSPTLLEIDDLATASGLVVVSRDDGGNVDTADSGLNTWTVNTDFIVEPLNNAAGTSVDAWPYTHLRVMPLGAFTFNTFFPRSVKVTAKFGWPATPGPVITATQLLAERAYKMLREAPMGVLAFEAGVVQVARADKNVMMLLSPYMKHKAAVG